MAEIQVGSVYRVAPYGLPFRVVVVAAAASGAISCRSLLTGRHLTVSAAELMDDDSASSTTVVVAPASTT